MSPDRAANSPAAPDAPVIPLADRRGLWGLRSDDPEERRLLRTLAALRQDAPMAPSDLVDEILAYVFSESATDATSRRRRYRRLIVACGAVGVAAGAVAGAVALRHNRRVLAAIEGLRAQVAEVAAQAPALRSRTA